MNASKIIYCPRSGLPLLEVSALCSQGWPMLSSIQHSFVHPVYSLDLSRLIARLSKQITDAEQSEWQPPQHERTEMSLSISAIMWSVEAITQDSTESTRTKEMAPTLPSWPVTLASAARLLHIAAWWHFASSKRLALPTYHVSDRNENLQWQNFAAFLDAAYSVKTEWETGRKKYESADEIKRRTDAVREVKDEHIYKRIDHKKVWNWIDAQIAQSSSYPLGRRETFKTLFLTGDLNPQDWVIDDVDDLCEAIFDLCDQGNEITHFIRTRMNHIRAILNDFYGSFTIVSSGGDSAMPSEDQTSQEKEFFAEFDRKVESLESLPPAPKREHFASLALFLRAQAQHNILVRRFNLFKK